MLLPSASLSVHDALKAGYRPLTLAFYLPFEREMLDRFQKDLKGIDYVLAGPITAPEIWRRGLIEDAKEIDER